MTAPEPKTQTDLKQLKKFIAESNGRFKIKKSDSEWGQYLITNASDQTLLTAQFGPKKDLQVVYAGDEARSPITVRQLIGSLTGS